MVWERDARDEATMRFYNPGSKISQMLQFTNTARDPRQGNTVSYYNMVAEEREFFEVPDVVHLDTPEGEVTMPVSFGKVIKRELAARGVIHIEPRAKDVMDEDNTARTDKEAREKGDRMWKNYLRAKASEWHMIVQETRAQGGVPRAASGLFAFALKELHMEDPADTVDTILRVRDEKTADTATQAKITALEAQVNQLIGALNQRTPNQTQPATDTAAVKR